MHAGARERTLVHFRDVREVSAGAFAREAGGLVARGLQVLVRDLAVSTLSNLPLGDAIRAT